jgi:hypothetical protein
MAGPLPPEVLQDRGAPRGRQPVHGRRRAARPGRERRARGLRRAGRSTRSRWPSAGRPARGAVLVRRLELLRSRRWRCCRWGRCSARSSTSELAVALAGRRRGRDGGGAGRAAAARLARRAHGRCAFFHDKIREALLERARRRERRALHGRAAEALARAGADSAAFELATTSTRPAGTEALPHALAAAEQAGRSTRSITAVVHYRIAERGAADDRTSPPAPDTRRAWATSAPCRAATRGRSAARGGAFAGAPTRRGGWRWRADSATWRSSGRRRTPVADRGERAGRLGRSVPRPTLVAARG